MNIYLSNFHVAADFSLIKLFFSLVKKYEHLIGCCFNSIGLVLMITYAILTQKYLFSFFSTDISILNGNVHTCTHI